MLAAAALPTSVRVFAAAAAASPRLEGSGMAAGRLAAAFAAAFAAAEGSGTAAGRLAAAFPTTEGSGTA